MPTGVELIAEERKRQIEVENWSSLHDDEVNHQGALALAAAAYALPEIIEPLYYEVQNKTGVHLSLQKHAFWPFAKKYWKPALTKRRDDRVRELVKAGALIAAEIDRLNRCHVNSNGIVFD